MEASNRKQNGLLPSSFRFWVETKAQLFRAAYRWRSSVMGVPIAHRPRPGGKNFIVKMRSNISCSGNSVETGIGRQ